ncbi:MAG: hypothetical protein LBL05_03260 [Synergistaceae bacterium]|nr:hypothetical protein [Synergistaceae bacterium]
MMSLVRSGPTIINLGVSGDGGENLTGYLQNISFKPSSNLFESYDHAGEGETLIVLETFVSGNKSETSIYQSTKAAANIMCDIINRGFADSIDNAKITPPNILMRLLGNMDAAIDQISKDFKARETTKNELVSNIGESSVLVNFTGEPLNKLVQVFMFHKRALLIDKPYGQLIAFLRAKAQEYLNISLGKPDWNEIEITIFDAMDQFNLHYQRLITVLQGLDVGVMVGEDWITEYTVALRKSEVYQIRLLTPLSPREIKRIALALEYDQDGRRLADFDVYVNKKKIGWATEKELNRGYARGDIGVLHRRRLMSSLPAEAKAVLLKLDESIDRNGPLKG